MRTTTLTPNCLISRHPLVFISGQRSPFYFSNYWNYIPHYLKEHGYTVLTINQISSMKYFLQKIREQKKQVHIIAPSSEEHSLQNLIEENDDTLSSASLVFCENQTRSHSFNENSLKPSKIAINEWIIPKGILKKEVSNSITRIKWTLHKWASYPKTTPYANTLALPIFSNLYEIEQSFLNYTIQLAEQDFRRGQNERCHS